MSTRQGYTLLEVIVASSLMLVILSLMVALLVPSFSLFRRQSGKSDSYRACLLLVHRFQQELQNSMLETVTIAVDHQAVAWQLGNVDPPFSASSGQPIMADRFSVLFYETQEQKVYLQQAAGSAGGPSTIPQRLTLPEIDFCRSNTDSSRRVMAHSITDFRVTDDDNNLDLMRPPLHLSLTCVIETTGTETNDEESFTLTASVTPRSVRW